MSSNHENGISEENNNHWPELVIPDLLLRDGTVKDIHSAIESEWDSLRRSACQTAAGRALWSHVIHDPLAELFAGEAYLKSIYEKIKKDKLNNAREISGVLLAVRTLWFDSKIEAALSSFQGNGGGSQVVLLGAGMDARAYRLDCLKETSVFEVDFPEVLEAKASIIDAAADSSDERHRPSMRSKSLSRVSADLTSDDWLERLEQYGFDPRKSTVWVLEGIVYYLPDRRTLKVLEEIADKCGAAHTVLLADFMNEQATAASKGGGSTFHFHCDWPDELLKSMGFSGVGLSQVGDEDANFGLLDDPLSLFHRLRGLPRTVRTNPEDGTPCARLYLVQARGSPRSC